MIVADASAIVELLLQTPLGSTIEERLYRSSEALHAPHLLDIEVLSALRRFVQKGEVSANRAEEALNDFTLLRIVRHRHLDFVERAWRLRANVAAYDAIYIALAESLDAPLLTCDAPMARSHGHFARIELVA